MLANFVYLFALVCASPVIVYRVVRFGRYRRGGGEKLLGLSRRRAQEMCPDGDCIWFHAVSVGEVGLIQGVVSQLESLLPNTTVVVSASTDAGYDLAVDKFGDDRVFFCPLDFNWAVNRTLKRLRPQQLILAELELWPNLIRAAHRRGCTVKVINGRLSQRSADRYVRFARFVRPTFERLTWVGCQDQESADRFVACGVPVDQVAVTGSIKFDDAPVSRDSDDVQSRLQWCGADPWHRIWMLGSSGPGEESMVLNIYKHLSGDHPELRLVIVPRHSERFDHVAGLIKLQGLNVHRRSQGQSLFDQSWDENTVILVDTIGELRHWWGVAQIATVGGTFRDRGGQNMLEPAGYGCAISFGPDTRNFKQIASGLIEMGGAVRTLSERELRIFVQRCLTDVPAADSLGRAARKMLLQHRGATERTIQRLASDTAESQQAGKAA